MKKVLSIFLAAVIVISLSSVAFAAPKILIKGNCGTNVKFELDSDYKLTISGRGEMKNYSTAEGKKAPWSKNIYDIKTIVVEEGVSSIGDYAFYDARFLTKASLPASLKRIGEGAFKDCKGLALLTMGGNQATVSESSFANCPELKSVNFPGYNHSLVTALNNSGTATVPYDPHAISLLVGKKLGSANNSALPVQDGKLVACKDQAPLIMEGRTLVPVRALSEALGANVLWDGITQTVAVSLNDTHLSLKLNAWEMTVNGKSVPLEAPASLINGRTLVPVRPIAEAFGCRVEWDNSTRTVVLYDSLTGTCGDKTQFTLDFLSGKLDITGTGAMKEWDSTNYTTCPWHNYKSYIRYVNIQEGITNVPYAAFFDCGNLVSATIPATVEKISASAFQNCFALQTISLPASITSIEESAFAYCKSLKSIVLKEGLVALGKWVFYGCESLTNATVPASLLVVGEGVFAECKSLKTLNYAGKNADVKQKLTN